MIGVISTILPLLVLGGLWYLIFKAGRTARNLVRAKPHGEFQPMTPTPPTGADGRRVADVTPRPFVPAAHLYPLSSFGGNKLRTPLGHDPAAPQSTTIPARFVGDWLWEGAATDRPQHRIALRPDSLLYHHGIGPEPVVGTWQASPDEIAVVTQQMENREWLFATYLFQLLDDGAKLTNLESMDMRWNRIA